MRKRLQPGFFKSIARFQSTLCVPRGFLKSIARFQSTLCVLSLVGALVAMQAAPSFAGDQSGAPAQRPARPAALTAEEKEILKHKELLENLELLKNFDKVKYLGFFGQSSERQDEKPKDDKAKEKHPGKVASKPR